MADLLATAIILVSVGVTFCLGCCAIVRVAYLDGHSRSDVLVAFYRVVVFAGAVVGCLAFSEAYGDEAAALFSVLLCACSTLVGGVLRKAWGRSEAFDVQQVEELRALVDRYREGEESLEARCARAARTYDLTRREEEILALLLQGRTRSEIARELFVSGDTVKTHIRNLYRKTGVAGKDQLVEALGARG
ncbi:helix-turn-helix transcriptional regulator [Eggerthella sinensis]|uniref:LuxR family transcriptional regulator n=1 Tax=Eggerthella sinensis TaxID=242230 RepID=A0A3N0IT47_9ACTN|nr:helix-turn-helix transcriptional regulator [Eggerthella sinensis]RDB65066.1 LuxR family transcriptional regulator [Eggerthella sinensis]RNM40145.1 LuxR family transcriptional regulator [Eggerthella sinensis]